MREYKFRAWDVEKERWCTEETLLQANGSVMFSHGEEHGDEIDIQFWTGLLDKNGKEIFEGDILKCGNAGNFAVEWVVMDSGIKIQYGYSHKHNFPAPSWVKVIGNVWENPELLTPQKEKESAK